MLRERCSLWGSVSHSADWRKETLEAILGTAATSHFQEMRDHWLWVCIYLCVLLVCAGYLFESLHEGFSCVRFVSFPPLFLRFPPLELWFSWFVLYNTEVKSVHVKHPPSAHCNSWLSAMVWSFHKVCVCFHAVGGQPLWFPKTSWSGLIAFRQQSLLSGGGKMLGGVKWQRKECVHPCVCVRETQRDRGREKMGWRSVGENLQKNMTL